MKDFKDIETDILVTILIAHTSNYAKSFSDGKSKETLSAISSLLAELAVRKETYENCYYKCIPSHHKQL